MKLNFLSFGFLIFLTSLGANAQSELEWSLDFDQAKATAQESNKLILMSFQGSDWCGNCKRLEKALFQDAAFIDFAQTNLVVLKVDFPRQKENRLSKEQTARNEALADLYNQEGIFPKVIIFNAKGERLGEMEQPLANSEAYMNSIKAFLE